MKVSPRYTERRWKAAFDGREDWGTAIDIVEDRIRGRWLEPADRLNDAYSGFAILALDCIVLESLWGFMHGKAVPRREEQQVYRDILMGPKFGWAAPLCDEFREFVRNGVMHDAETRRGWLVERTVPKEAIAAKNTHGNYLLNRTKFHHALKATFEDWVARLRSGDAEARAKMRDRMNQIIEKHYAH